MEKRVCEHVNGRKRESVKEGRRENSVKRVIEKGRIQADGKKILRIKKV